MNKVILYRIKTLDELIEKKPKAIINNDFISYFEDETKVKYNYKTSIITRENKDIYIKYDFNKEKASIKDKELNRRFYPKIKVLDKKIDNYNIYIKFSVEGIEIEYEVEVIK